MSRTSLVSLATVPLLGALATLTLSGCGTTDPQIPQGSSSSVTKKASFPLTVSRLGGVAGFSDNLSIQDDGEVLATTKKGRVTCTIDKASLAVLNDAALQVHDTDQPTAPATRPADYMMVMFGAGTGLLSVHDPRVVKAEPVVTQLLADVTGPAASRKICT